MTSAFRDMSQPAVHPAPPVEAIAPTSLEWQIGNTPLLSFKRITAHLPENVTVLAKAEWTNPGGSVKDRAALQIIREAERDGLLKPGRIILDSTSGNTGIAYAMIGAAKGYRVKLFLPANATPERIAILRAYGADLVLTDPLEGSDGALREARQLAAAEPERYFYADQYSNPANWHAHYYGTAPEIWRQTSGTVTHFVAGLGTSGTLMGTGKRLKEYNPAIRAISLQPDSPFHGVEGWKHMQTAMKPAIYNAGFADGDVAISTEAAQAMARRLAREEGYLVGVSAAGAMAGALRVAEGIAERGAAGVVVTLFPDNAYKYLSESFWTD